jgi:hypothetical protein
MFRKNVASQVVAAQLLSASGENVTSGTTTVYYLGDAATQTAASATATHEGNGCWSFGPSQAETNFDHVAYTFTNTNSISVTVQAWPVSFDPTDAVRAGLTALPNANADAAGGLVISDAGGLDIDAMDSNVSDILTDTAEIGAAGAGLTAIPWNAAWDAEVESEVTDVVGANGASLSAIPWNAAWDAEVESEVDDALGAGGADLTAIPWNAAWDAEVQSEVNDGLVAFFTSAAQLVDDVWDEAKAGHAGAGSFGEEVQAHSLSTEVAGLNDISTADVNAEVLDVIDTDTRGEPAQGAPGATISLGDKIDYLYKAWRNRCTTTASVYSVFNDDAATVDHKATISDDGTTFTVGEVGTGP